MIKIKDMDVFNQVEILRQDMYEAYQKQPDGEEVIKISQELDKVLNQLMKLL